MNQVSLDLSCRKLQELAEIHDYISRQIEIGLKERDKTLSRGDECHLYFIKGKISELRRIRTYLSDHFDLITQKYY